MFPPNLLTTVIGRFGCVQIFLYTRILHAAQPLLQLANNAARIQIHNYLCQECGGCRQGYGRIEVHSFSLQRRERTLAARAEVLEMLEVKEGG